MTATGRKKLDELYHPVTDRSEFYCMSDIAKPPVLFTPSDDIEKVSESSPSPRPDFVVIKSKHLCSFVFTIFASQLSQMDLQTFYSHESEIAGPDGKPATYMLHANKASTPTLKFHNHFPPDLAAWVVKIEHMKSNLRREILSEFFFVLYQLNNFQTTFCFPLLTRSLSIHQIDRSVDVDTFFCEMSKRVRLEEGKKSESCSKCEHEKMKINDFSVRSLQQW